MKKMNLVLLLSVMGVVAKEGKLPDVSFKGMPPVAVPSGEKTVPLLDLEPYKNVIMAFKEARGTEAYVKARDSLVANIKNFAKTFMKEAVANTDEKGKKIIVDIAQIIKTPLDEIEKDVVERFKYGLSKEEKQKIDDRIKEKMLKIQLGLMFSTMPFGEAVKQEPKIKMSEGEAQEASRYWIQTVLSIIREILSVVE